VFDVLPAQAHFSYHRPPLTTAPSAAGGGGGAAAPAAACAPVSVIAMPRPGCTSLPAIDELLDLSAAAAAAATAAAVAAGGACSTGLAAAAVGAAASRRAPHPQQQRVAYQPVQFALAEDGDVAFCQLTPARLMDLLANGRVV
jgi:hypothetical protein